MYTTVNNWICKRFINHLFSHRFYACINLFYNVFSQLDEIVVNRMLCYFFDEIVHAYDSSMLSSSIIDLQEHDLFIKEPLLLVNYLTMRERYFCFINCNTKFKS